MRAAAFFVACAALRGSGASATKPPHLISVFADDLGWYDTAIHNEGAPTPALKALASEGYVLERHYVFRYCSPSRRSFLSGRFPTSITSVQPDGANLCSDFLPLATTTIAEKLSVGAGYECHFIGKGHLGYETTDHLPVRRGFASHVGFLGGAESYHHGATTTPKQKTVDLWEGDAPARALAEAMNYSTAYYASRAVEIITERRAAPLFVYLALQNVHAPYQLPPEAERGDFPDFPLCADCVYAQMLHALDVNVAKVADALKATQAWGETLFLFTADNGGVGAFGNNRPLRGHKHDPWEGGTRAVAFLAGGVLPAHLRGRRSGDKFVHVADWYATFCALAGVDATDDAVFDGVPRAVDSVDVWPLLTGANATQPRPVTPVTEVSVVDAASPANWWKLVTLAGQSVRYAANASQTPATSPCLDGRQPDPPQPGRTDPVVTSPDCPVCNATDPCLFDILNDPEETDDVAADHPAVVARLAAALDAASLYYATGHLDPDVLKAKYAKVDNASWGGFYAPCYAPL